MSGIALIVITIKYRDSVFQVDIEEDQTVLNLKSRLESLLDVPSERQRVVHDGKILKDDDSVGYLGDETLYIVKLADNKIVGSDEFENSSNEMLKSMMKSPLFKNMFVNGDVLKSVITSNPQMKTVLEKNPELEQIINNPTIMRDAIEAMGNPSYQKEMIRSNDRALSNIEMLPDGFNALRRAYSSVQEPMLEALGDVAHIPIVEDCEDSKTLNKLNEEPLPNIWSDSRHSARSMQGEKKNDQRTSTASIETRFKQELKDLQEMGFSNHQDNINALNETDGNLESAIERLLNK